MPPATTAQVDRLEDELREVRDWRPQHEARDDLRFGLLDGKVDAMRADLADANGKLDRLLEQRSQPWAPPPWLGTAGKAVAIVATPTIIAVLGWYGLAPQDAPAVHVVEQTSTVSAPEPSGPALEPSPQE